MKHYPLRIVKTANGIRAQALHTLNSRVWWAKRWVNALEAMKMGARLGRARQYALTGQVIKLEINSSHVEALVQGSRDEPYTVTLDFTADKDGVVIKQLQTEPMLLARLLTDDLPLEVEELFRDNHLPLFPQPNPIGVNDNGKKIWDVQMHCSCPDWARPCKHIASVLFLLGEAITCHPLLLLALRGIEVEENVQADTSNTSFDLPLVKPNDTIEIAEVAPLIKRLGAIPFWRGQARCVESLTRIYSRVNKVALEAANGKSIDLR